VIEVMGEVPKVLWSALKHLELKCGYSLQMQRSVGKIVNAVLIHQLIGMRRVNMLSNDKGTFINIIIVNTLKFFLTLSITIAMLLLMDPRSFYGLEFHEWAGLIIGLFFILHKLLNWGWIKKVTVKFFTKAPGRARLNYIIDVLLLAGMILMILSGIAIARTIDFSWLKLDGSRMFWRAMHTSSSFITLVLFGIHLGLHWKWVLGRFNFIKIKK
jgi:hypothetical protein